MTVSTGIPGVNTAALNAISDPNTRDVLQSLIDGWNVRNGNTSNQASAFITQDDLNTLAAGSTSFNTTLKQLVSSAVGSAVETNFLDPGAISKAMADLHQQVFESFLFKTMEARVDLIDKPGGIFERVGATELTLKNEIQQRIDGDIGLSTSLSAMGTRIGNAEAAISTETTQRVNSDSALQTTINTQYSSVQNSLSLVQNQINTNANNVSSLTSTLNTVQASLNSLSAVVQEEKTARVNADNTLYAQWTVKLDVNGYVSGFGMANNGQTASVIFRTDNFSIVSPNGNRSALIMQSNCINVYDENGTPRVRIGRLS